MRVLTYIERTVSDQEPDSHGDVTVKRSEDREDITLAQSDDMVMMTPPHARAVAAALIALADEMDPQS